LFLIIIPILIVIILYFILDEFNGIKEEDEEELEE
jgi:hypothetical protein